MTYASTFWEANLCLILQLWFISYYIHDLLGIEFVSEINTKNRTRGVQIPPFIIPLLKKTMKTVFFSTFRRMSSNQITGLPERVFFSLKKLQFLFVYLLLLLWICASWLTVRDTHAQWELTLNKHYKGHFALERIKTRNSSTYILNRSRQSFFWLLKTIIIFLARCAHFRNVFSKVRKKERSLATGKIIEGTSS